MADAANASGNGDGDRDLGPEDIAAMSPGEREQWMARLEFAPVDDVEAGRLLATLPPQPAEPAHGVIPIAPQADRPPLRRRGGSDANPGRSTA
jgi:hypothetical protein